MDIEPVELSVSQFVDLFNQTLEFAYPSVVITGELANFRVSRNRWVYFDLKDEFSTIKFFGTVYQLPGPLEEGMILKVRGQPKLHNLYGFSVNVLSMQPAGEGSIKKAADLLKAQLVKEGLFDESRKREIPYPPERIGLITSKQSAAYADFIKIINARWAGLQIDLIDVQVQGEVAPAQIVAALKQFNASPEPPETIVIIRGGGSAEDLMAFSSEEVTRAVAASRVPTVVAIGHEVDLSLAELAADLRASTPSNAAELLVPERKAYLKDLENLKVSMLLRVESHIKASRVEIDHQTSYIRESLIKLVKQARLSLNGQASLVEAFNPDAILRRGYSIVRNEQSKVLRNTLGLKPGSKVDVKLYSGSFKANVEVTKE
jgi:exodeoxyribonuclease VII large subunit